MKHPRRYFTLIQSAKRHGIDPFAYLRDILLRITAEPGIAPPLLPALLWGELLHVGKASAFGLGKYRLEVRQSCIPARVQEQNRSTDNE